MAYEKPQTSITFELNDGSTIRFSVDGDVLVVERDDALDSTSYRLRRNEALRVRDYLDAWLTRPGEAQTMLTGSATPFTPVLGAIAYSGDLICTACNAVGHFGGPTREAVESFFQEWMRTHRTVRTPQLVCAEVHGVGYKIIPRDLTA